MLLVRNWRIDVSRLGSEAVQSRMNFFEVAYVNGQMSICPRAQFDSFLETQFEEIEIAFGWSVLPKEVSVDFNCYTMSRRGFGHLDHEPIVNLFH